MTDFFYFRSAVSSKYYLTIKKSFQGLGFADSTLFVAVSAGFLRAIGSAMAGVIVVFKGRRFTLLFSCIGAIVSIEVATG